MDFEALFVDLVLTMNTLVGVMFLHLLGDFPHVLQLCLRISKDVVIYKVI